MMSCVLRQTEEPVIDGDHEEGTKLMRTRRLGKAVVGLATACAVIGLLGLPVSANEAEITSGTLELYSSDNTLVESIDMGPGNGTDCDPTLVNTITMTLTSTGPPPSGTWTATIESDTAGAPVGFRSRLSASFSGTFSGSTLTGTGTATAIIRPLTPSTTDDPCATVTTGTPCTVTVTAIVVTGTHTVTFPPGLQMGDSATISGDNAPGGDLGFELGVTGTCGSLIALDDGYVSLIDVTIVATT
jgi:hypothetical protein